MHGQCPRCRLKSVLLIRAGSGIAYPDMLKSPRDDSGLETKMLVSIPKVWFPLISLGERIVHPKLSLVCGVQYFESSSVDRWPTPLSLSTVDDTRRLRCRDDDPSCPSVVHNNWIVSREAKTYRFKEHLLWMYDKGRLKLDGIHLNSHYDNGNVVENGIHLGLIGSSNWRLKLITGQTFTKTPIIFGPVYALHCFDSVEWR